jgi:hypothetical protein
VISRSLLTCITAALALFAAERVQARGPIQNVPNTVAPVYDVAIDVLPDGSLDVVERISLAVGGAPVTSFERQVPGRRTDGFTNIVALVDGRVAPPFHDDAGVRIDQRGSNLDARWAFEPASNRTLTFELRYRAIHALGRDETGFRLRWPALPAEHGYPIESARVTVRAPQKALAVSVSAEGGDIHEATSWQDGLLVTRTAVAPDDTIVLDIVFSSGTITPAEPAWVVTAEQAQRLMPAFITAAISLLAIGAGTLLMIVLRAASMRGHAAGPASASASASASADRASTARGLVTSGIVLAVLALIGGAAVLALFQRLGPALVAVPAAVLVDGIAFFIAGRLMSRRQP